MDDALHHKVFVAGDVMTGRGIDQALRHPSDPELRERYVRDARDYVRLAEQRNGPITRPMDHIGPWGDAIGLWDQYAPDLRIVNLETSITTSADFWPSKGIHYRMNPKNTACLTAARLDCCVTANNHVLDLGYAGLAQTLAALEGAGIAAPGAGTDIAAASRPARLSVPNRADVLVFSLADTSSGVPRSWAAGRDKPGVYVFDGLTPAVAEEVAERSAEHRKAGELVVVSIHWGGNWGYHVPDEQRRFARSLIDAGAADVVHGHSSHHVKAIECYGGKLIIYGTGDFLTDYEGIGGHEHYRPWLSLMYFLTLDSESGNLKRLDVVPLRLRRFRLTAARNEDCEWLATVMGRTTMTSGVSLESLNGRLTVRPIPPAETNS